MNKECCCHNPFCLGLSDEVREKLCSIAHKVTYKKFNEQLIFFNFERILIIEEGAALLSRGGHVSERQQGTDILEPGNLVGVVQAFHPDYEAAINLLPLTPLTGCLINLHEIENLITIYPELAVAMLTEFSERFGRIASKLAIHSYGSAQERLDFTLSRVEELGLNNTVTQEQLARLSGLSRVTVNKLMQVTKN